MNYLINQLMTVDKAFYRHYLEMLLTLNRIQALTPWQMSMLLWRAKIFHIQVLYPELLRISLCTEQEKDEIRFMKGWKLKELEKIMPAWQRRQCVTRNFAASLFRNIKYFTLRKLYLCRKWMQKRLQKTTTTGITLPNFDFLA